MSIRITITTKTNSRFTQSDLNAIMREAWEAGLTDQWHADTLPRHFRTGAVLEYGYKQRSRHYTRRKLQQQGHARPLEFSGRLRSQVLSRATVDVRRSRNESRGTVSLRGPRYLGAARNPRRPNLAAELAARSERDQRKLATFLEKKVAAELNKPGRTRSVR